MALASHAKCALQARGAPWRRAWTSWRARLHAGAQSGSSEPEGEYDDQGRYIVGGEGPDVIYIGKGQFVRGNMRDYPDKEMGGLTGGWPGGELGIKESPREFKQGDRVRVKGGFAPWMHNPLFAVGTLRYSGKLGQVLRSEVQRGITQVAVTLDADEPPASQQGTAVNEWSKTVLFDSRDLELVEGLN